ncbi:MAG: GH3 auxin-responsive promoter family protein [Methanobacteriaceae archaeon]|nr:GH3 auxin-responsive promoter family protein [Methanobacteriaceae archaeon]
MSKAGIINLEKVKKGRQTYENFQKITKNPFETNQKLLKKIIKDNKHTTFGKKYNFDNIKTIQDYQKQVPITTYNDYEKYIELMTQENKTNLITVYEVDHYSESSGTTGHPKMVPLSKIDQKTHSKYSKYRYALLEDKIGLNWIDGKSLAIRDATLETLNSGASFGSLSCKLILENKNILTKRNTSPEEALFYGKDTDIQYIHSRFALMDENITTFSCTFHSFFLEILRYIEDNWKLLVEDIKTGTINKSIKLSKNIRKSLETKIKPQPQRAQYLEKCFKKGFDKPIIPCIWPKAEVLYGIGTGTFKIYSDEIRKRYVGKNFTFYLFGLIASEGYLSLPIDVNSDKFALVPDSVFYEFRDLNDNNYSNCLTIDQLEIGKKYEVIITNCSGFYRYNLQDVIEIVDTYNQTPVMEYCYRLNQSIDLFGEKITESIFRDIISIVTKELNWNITDFSVYPEINSNPFHYTFLFEEWNENNVSIEDIKESLERNLKKYSRDYMLERSKSTLGELEIKFLKENTYNNYIKMKQKELVSASQVKPPHILTTDKQKEFFNENLKN